MRNLRLLGDLILVRPDPEPEKLGTLFAPTGALPQGHRPADDLVKFAGIEQRVGDGRETFQGTVVATGPGDKFHERLVHGRIKRTLIHPDGSRAPMHTKVGDRVLYGRRPSGPQGTTERDGDAAVYLDGERFLLFHEEQSAFAVIGTAA